MHLAEINEVIKASPAIQIQSKISLLQRRAWNVLLANAYNELPDKDIYRVSMVELAAKLGFDSGNQEHLKETLKSLVDCTVEWNLLNKDNKQVWGVASLLASAEIEAGLCTYSFSPHLRLKLYNPRMYTKLNLRLQNRFKSRYALTLWEICFDYFDTARAQGETPFMPIETFRELMGLENNEYPVFKVLNRDVIKPGIQEINELTDYFVEVEPRRIGRRVAELKFRITKVKQLPIQDSVFPDVENLPPVALELAQAGIDRKMALKISEQGWEIVAPQKLPPPGTYPDFAAYVTEKIGLAAYAPGLSNPGGFIVEAIRENYQDPVLQKRLQANKEREKHAMLESLREECLVKQHALIRQAVRANPALLEHAAAQITSGFVRERLQEYATVKDAYDAAGLVAGDLNFILAKGVCAELIAPVVQAYEDEKARIQQETPTPHATPKDSSQKREDSTMSATIVMPS